MKLRIIYLILAIVLCRSLFAVENLSNTKIELKSAIIFKNRVKKNIFDKKNAEDDESLSKELKHQPSFLFQYSDIDSEEEDEEQSKLSKHHKKNKNKQNKAKFLSFETVNTKSAKLIDLYSGPYMSSHSYSKIVSDSSSLSDSLSSSDTSSYSCSSSNTNSYSSLSSVSCKSSNHSHYHSHSISHITHSIKLNIHIIRQSKNNSKFSLKSLLQTTSYKSFTLDPYDSASEIWSYTSPGYTTPSPNEYNEFSINSSSHYNYKYSSLY